MGKIRDDSLWHWKPALSVGIRAIDEDHKKIFQLLNEARLAAGSGDEDASLLHGLVRELILYVESHFKREEAIMVASSNPAAETHFAEHRRLLAMVQTMLDKVTNGEGSMAELVCFVRDTLVTHIQERDEELSHPILESGVDVEQVLKKVGPLTLPEGLKIYIVDDEPQQVEMLSEIVDVAGFSSDCFTSAPLFVEQPVTHNDIVLLDLNMPDMDGIEVIRTLYNQGCSPTYLLISGFDERVLHSAKQFAEAKNIEVAATFTKPLDTRAFMDKIISLHAKKKLAFDKKVYRAEPERGVAKHNNLSVEEFKVALKERQLVLFYQPQIDIGTGAIHGYEALVRLQHPARGLLFPDQFIELAEQNNLISELTDEVFRLVIEDYAKFQELEIDKKVSVNISAQDLLDLSLPERLASQLQAKDIKANSIMIELTETALMSSVSDSLDILNRLRMKGFSLSIDDFGTGHSSLVQLYQAPFTELKIDLHFVMRMVTDNEARAIVKICILLAKELNLETVAEGVESQEIFDELKSLGCDIAQGYHISKPLPLGECCKWVLAYDEARHLNIEGDIPTEERGAAA